MIFAETSYLGNKSQGFIQACCVHICLSMYILGTNYMIDQYIVANRFAAPDMTLNTVINNNQILAIFKFRKTHGKSQQFVIIKLCFVLFQKRRSKIKDFYEF